MRKYASLFIGLIMLGTLSGCVVAPVPYQADAVYVAPQPAYGHYRYYDEPRYYRHRGPAWRRHW